MSVLTPGLSSAPPAADLHGDRLPVPGAPTGGDADVVTSPTRAAAGEAPGRPGLSASRQFTYATVERSSSSSITIVQDAARLLTATVVSNRGFLPGHNVDAAVAVNLLPRASRYQQDGMQLSYNREQRHHSLTVGGSTRRGDNNPFETRPSFS